MDALVDNQAVVQAWNNQSGKSGPLNKALKRLFFTTVDLNVSLRLSYISTNDNPADSHSRHLSTMDSKLCPALWKVVEQEFGGPTGHTCDLMALNSNAMKDKLVLCFLKSFRRSCSVLVLDMYPRKYRYFLSTK